MNYSGKEFDVVVIGAGIMGSCAAYQIVKRGQTVLLLDQFDFLHQQGSSHGESRTIRTTYPEDYYTDMVVQSFHLWEEAEEEVGYKVYFKTPHFDMGPKDNKSLCAVIQNCKSNSSVTHQVLDPEESSTHFSISLPENWAGLATQGGVIKPTKAVSMFQTLALKRGAVLRDNTEVTEIRRRDQEKGGISVFTTNGSEYWGRKCVVTVGAWMQKLVKIVTGLVLPVQPLHTTICYWRIKEGHQDEFSIKGGFPSFASYGNPYIYGTPALEYPGLLKVAVHGGYPCDPDNRTWAPNSLQHSVKSWIEDRFGGWVESKEPAVVQSCMYSMTPDGDFLIDFLGGEFGKEVVVAGGFSGHGFKMGPVVGRILADMVLDGEALGVEMKHFRLSRFEENPKGNVKEYEDQVDSHVFPDDPCM